MIISNSYLILLIICIIFTLYYNKEEFNNDTLELDGKDIELFKYDNYKIDKLDLKKQRFLMYLDKINNEYKKNIKMESDVRGTFDNKVAEKIQKRSLKSVYELKQQDEEYKKYNKYKEASNGGVDCVGISSYLCEYTNPYLYLSESKYFPPQWVVKQYKDIDLPKTIDLNCYNKTNDCCRWSLRDAK